MMLITWSIPSAAITTMTMMAATPPRCTSASDDFPTHKGTGPTTSSGPNISGGRTGNTGPDPPITDTGDTVITATGDMVITVTGDMATMVIIGASRAQLFVIIDASFKILNFFKYLLFMEKKQITKDFVNRFFV